MDSNRKKITIHRKQKQDLYESVLDFQQTLFNKNLALKVADLSTENHLLFCEHPPTYTIGKHGDKAHLLFDPLAMGATFHQIDRGGDITFHGPGQLVIYPIFDLDNFGMGTAHFVEILENAVISMLVKLNITADRLKGAAGIWVNIDTYPKKVCAIGIKVSKHITMHGIAINVFTDLSWFQKIVPCGLADKGVTSILELTQKQYSLEEIEDLFCKELLALL